jgi:hypothetical protein
LAADPGPSGGRSHQQTKEKTLNQDVKDILARHKHLAEERRTWEGHWQDLAEVMLPRRADFTGQAAAGGKRTDRIYDGTPMLARRGLSSAIDGLLTPKTSQWFQIKVQDDDLAEDDEVKAWIDESERRLMSALYDPKARFIQSSGEVNDDLVTQPAGGGGGAGDGGGGNGGKGQCIVITF